MNVHGAKAGLPASARGRAGFIGGFRFAAMLGVLMLLTASGCDLFGGDSGGGGSSSISSAPFSTADFVTPSNVTSLVNGAKDITASVPEDSVSMGIVVIGTDEERKFIEHAGLFLGGDDNITGPDGAVPLAFNTIDGDPSPSALNNEAVAVHFPNDGKSKTMSAGTYKFPVGAANASGNLVADTLSSVVFYKTTTSQTPTLTLNVFVLNGADAGITNTTQAQNDPEIQGAVAVLENVYANNASIGVSVDITVQFLPDGNTCLSVDGLISFESEQFCLLRTYPLVQTDDAMNIFVISSLDYIEPDAGGGVIGLAAGIPGPFNLQGLATSGTMAEYQGDGAGTILGFTLAHEFGHFLGLFHTSQTNESATGIVGFDPISDTKVCSSSEIGVDIFECSDFGNLMFPFVDNEADPPVSKGQGNVVKYNPGITVP